MTFILCCCAPARIVSDAVCMSVLTSSALLLTPALQASQQHVMVVRQYEQVMAARTQASNPPTSQRRVVLKC